MKHELVAISRFVDKHWRARFLKILVELKQNNSLTIL